MPSTMASPTPTATLSCTAHQACSGFLTLSLGVLLDALAERIVARLLASSPSPNHPEHADARANPLGTARAFLDAGRRGDFPTFKRGREIVARWVDVLAYIERRAVARKERMACSEQPTPTQPSRHPPAETPAERRKRLLRAAKLLPPGC